MKNLFLVFIIFLGCVITSQAQDYDSAIGLRLGYPNSVTYKKFVSESNAIELYGGIRSYFGSTLININGAYQIYTPIESVDNLQWYYGAGAGVNLGNGFTSISLSGYIGLDYRFEDIPIALSIDYVPTYFLGSSALNFQSGYGNLAVRYILCE
jgi:hypothetical protein